MLIKIWTFSCDQCNAQDLGYLSDNKKVAADMFKESGYLINGNGRCFCDKECKSKYYLGLGIVG